VLASASPKGPGPSGTRRPIRGAAGLGPSARAPVRPTIHSDPAPAPAAGSGHVCHGSPRGASCDGGVGSDAGGAGGPTGTPSTAVLAAALQAYRGPNVGTLTFGAPWSVTGGGTGGGGGAAGAERARGPLHHKAPAPLVLRTVEGGGPIHIATTPTPTRRIPRSPSGSARGGSGSGSPVPSGSSPVGVGVVNPLSPTASASGSGLRYRRVVLRPTFAVREGEGGSRVAHQPHTEVVVQPGGRNSSQHRDQAAVSGAPQSHTVPVVVHEVVVRSR
jgi:hypothetical protein